jgi:hypothetical protein
MQQLGEVGVAQTTLAIAIHTFVAVWWSKGIHSLGVAKAVVTLIWLFTGLFVITGTAIHANKLTLYESPTPYWCWIGGQYKRTRIFGEYLWLWLTLIFSFLAYIPLFLWSRGNITVDPTRWWKFRVHKSTHQTADLLDPGGRRRRSLSLIAYPLVYSVIVLPLSIVRWIGFSQESRGVNHISSAATISVISIYGLSGMFNVLLFLLTRPDRLLFTGPTPIFTPAIQSPDLDIRYNHIPLGRLPSPSENTWDPNPQSPRSMH